MSRVGLAVEAPCVATLTARVNTHRVTPPHATAMPEGATPRAIRAR